MWKDDFHNPSDSRPPRKTPASLGGNDVSRTVISTSCELGTQVTRHRGLGWHSLQVRPGRRLHTDPRPVLRVSRVPATLPDHDPHRHPRPVFPVERFDPNLPDSRPRDPFPTSSLYPTYSTFPSLDRSVWGPTWSLRDFHVPGGSW